MPLYFLKQEILTDSENLLVARSSMAASVMTHLQAGKRLTIWLKERIIFVEVEGVSRLASRFKGSPFFVGHSRASPIPTNHASISLSSHPQEFPPRRTLFGNLPSRSILQIVASLNPARLNTSGFRMIRSRCSDFFSIIADSFSELILADRAGSNH
jgi:hypothetical protein